MAAAQASHVQTYAVAIDQLVSLFELNLILSLIAHFESALESGLSLGFNNIVAVFGFVDQNPHALLVNLNHAAANREVLQLVIAIGFLAADRYRARLRHCH